MKTQFKTIDEYVRAFPPDVQAILEKMRWTIRRAVPEAREAISYQIPTFKLNGRNVVHFAAWRDHISMYPIPSAPESFIKVLSPYIKGKGTLQFPLSRPVPYDLVEKIVEYLVKENSAKKQPKKPHEGIHHNPE